MNVRVDTGIRQGDEVSIYYDPMIAKLIVWERDRDTALARLRGALADYQVVGLTTNLNFLSALAANEVFQKQQIDTSFIEKLGLIIVGFTYIILPLLVFLRYPLL